MAEWRQSAEAYQELIGDPEWDSRYLRESGLIPNVVNLIGNCNDATLLDAGTGTGWLFDHVSPARAFACDIVEPEFIPHDVKFSRQDVSSLDYRDDEFDIIVASLLLMFCKDLDKICAEFYRISKPGSGRLIVSLVHPYFYRTGEVDESGRVTITENLSRPFTMEVEIGGHVGPLTYYFRPYSMYINALVAAGWRIEAVRDWHVDMNEYRKMAGTSFKSKIGRTDKVPLYTFFQCVAEG